MPKATVYLGLGGNMGDPLSLIRKSLEEILQLPVEQLEVSRLYQTSPVSNLNQNAFINAACRFRTDMDPKTILKWMQKIECSLGKIPKPKNAPRPIDIDILFYGSDCYRDQDLVIPHPEWKKRLFVLVPLTDLVSELEIFTDQGSQRFVLKDLVHKLNQQTDQVVSLLDKKIFLDYA